MSAGTALMSAGKGAPRRMRTSTWPLSISDTMASAVGPASRLDPVHSVARAPLAELERGQGIIRHLGNRAQQRVVESAVVRGDVARKVTDVVGVEGHAHAYAGAQAFTHECPRDDVAAVGLVRTGGEPCDVLAAKGRKPRPHAYPQDPGTHDGLKGSAAIARGVATFLRRRQNAQGPPGRLLLPVLTSLELTCSTTRSP